MKSKLVYWLTYAGMWLLALLPFRALYILSDGVCFLMRHVVHYRRKVVRKNLKNSFPEKSEAELREIEREFYRYICDYMLEEIKMMRMSFEDLSRRMEYGNTEEYLAMLEKHGGIVVLIPHYANFEWLTAMGAFMKPEDVPLQVYKPLRNKYMDEMFKIATKSPEEEAKIISANTGYDNIENLKKMCIIKQHILDLIMSEGDASEQICSPRRLICWSKKAKRTGEFIESSLSTVIAHLSIYDESFSHLTVEEVLNSDGIAATVMDEIKEQFEGVVY